MKRLISLFLALLMVVSSVPAIAQEEAPVEEAPAIVETIEEQPQPEPVAEPVKEEPAPVEQPAEEATEAPAETPSEPEENTPPH